MKNDPFRTDPVLAVIEQERQELVAQMVGKRRDAVIDVSFCAAGTLASVLSTFAPWVVLFEVFHVGWIPYLFVAVFGALSVWHAFTAISSHHWLLRLS
ncbi:MAG: hypothetical protein WC654_01615 [Patescibacteria group bacterium]